MLKDLKVPVWARILILVLVLIAAVLMTVAFWPYKEIIKGPVTEVIQTDQPDIQHGARPQVVITDKGHGSATVTVPVKNGALGSPGAAENLKTIDNAAANPAPAGVLVSSPLIFSGQGILDTIYTNPAGEKIGTGQTTVDWTATETPLASEKLQLDLVFDSARTIALEIEQERPKWKFGVGGMIGGTAAAGNLLKINFDWEGYFEAIRAFYWHDIELDALARVARTNEEWKLAIGAGVYWTR